ncbi:MAG TPA: asparagine synthase (glutamine-hydrolyzing) [Actinomycetota bacterium]|nr:asparagine synthase (glutamine-hydrolyzing) [Actinomycetota bacterium]
MCGICGIVSAAGPPEVPLVRAMIGQLRHRGPDGSGYFRDGRAALGHARLAIIDMAGGAQPMSNEDGSIWISFNGEIFNYVELARELRSLGHQFRTASDTEVIIHAWEEWGAASFDRFNGQWAFALWDRRARRLILCRDRMGVRPLYYARTPERFLFASEVKALFADPQMPRELDPVGLDEVLTYWSTVAPRTVFRGVEQLPPGHFAVLDAEGFRSAPYWSIDFPARGSEPSRDATTNADELRERLIEASRLRFLRSDVPVGAYLSGGIDSSITAAVVARYTAAPLHTFSLRFDDPAFDEGGYQKQMTTLLGTEHRDVVVSPADIAEVFPEVVWHAETPILRSAPAPLFLLSRLVRQNGYKVVVTGEGADEILGGYDIYREARVRLFWSRDQGSTKRARAAELLYPWMTRSPGAAPAFARSFFAMHLDPNDPAISHRPRWQSTAAVKALLTPAWRQEALVADPARLAAALPKGSADWDPLARAQWLEMTTLLPGYILASQGDRMLMANSIEGRFPFLDREVMALANALPAHHKLLALDEKHLLKRSFADMIPAEILRRAKQPYRSPDAASFFFDGTLPDWFGDLTTPSALGASGIFDPGLVAGLLAKGTRTHGRNFGNTDNMRVLAVISTQLLHHQFIATDVAGTVHSPPEPLHVIDLVNQERER